MTDKQPLDIDDFTGGITDYPIDAPLNAAAFMGNFYITPNKKLATRGCDLHYVDQQVAETPDRIALLVNHDEELLVLRNIRAYYKSNDTTWGEINGPNGATDAAIAGLSSDASITYNVARWKGHTYICSDAVTTPQKIFKDSTGTWQVRTAGLPEPDISALTDANFVGTGVASTKNFIYYFCWKYTYTVGDVTFIDRGPCASYLLDLVTNHASSITGLPTTLTVTENRQVTGAGKIQLETYRTTNNGKTAYLIDTQDITVGSATDASTDLTVVLNAALYINGGNPDRDPPPKCKFVHIVDDTAYYGYCVDTGATDPTPTLLKQSIPGSPDAVPGDFTLDLKETIKGISSYNSKPIVFCANEVFRIEGKFDGQGRGFMKAVSISPNAGCLNHNSIVQTSVGVFWAGKDGFYTTDAFGVKKISDHLNKIRYPGISSNAERQSRIVGTYDAKNERVLWTACLEDGGDECDIIFVLDLRWGLRDMTSGQTPATFTTWSGTYMAPTALTVIGDEIVRGDAQGYVFTLSDDELSDKIILATGDPSTFKKCTRLWDYRSGVWSYGTRFIRKMATWMLVSCENDTNLSLGIISSNDNGRLEGELKPIRYRGSITWSISSVFWGEGGYLWMYQGIIEEKRNFPAAGGFRYNYKQIQFTNAHVVVITSESLGAATLDQSAKTLVLGAPGVWPTNFNGYYVALENDGYTTEFEIASVSGDTVTLVDDSNLLPIDGDYAFVVRGQPKDENLILNGYSVGWKLLSDSHKPFRSSGTGEP